MVHIPDQLTNHKAKSQQNGYYTVAWLLAIVGGIALANGAGGGLLAILLGLVVGWVGSTIKTTYNRTGGIHRYK